MALNATTFDQCLTFSRPTAVDYTDKNGDTVTAAVNEPRLSYTGGVFEGLLLDSLLEETAGLNTIEDFSAVSGAFVMEGDFDDVLCFPGLGFPQSIAGSGTVVFSYRDGVGRIYANKQTLATVPSISVTLPSALTAGGSAAVRQWAYYRNLPESTLKSLSEGTITLSDTAAFTLDYVAQRFSLKDEIGAHQRKTAQQLLLNTRASDATVYDADLNQVIVPADTPAVGYDLLNDNVIGQDIFHQNITNELVDSENMVEGFTTYRGVLTTEAHPRFRNLHKLECNETDANNFQIGTGMVLSGTESTVLRFFIAKAGSISKIYAHGYSQSDLYHMRIDLETGNIERNSAGSAQKWGSIPLGDGFYLYCWQAEGGGTGSRRQFWIGSDQSHGPYNPGDYFYITCPQMTKNTDGYQWGYGNVEGGNGIVFPYVPTTGTSTYRGLDNVETSIDLQTAPWFNAEAFTVELYTTTIMRNKFSYFAIVSDDTPNALSRNCIRIRSNSNGDFSVNIWDANSDSVDVSTGTSTAVYGTPVRIVFSISASKILLRYQGQTYETNNPGYVPPYSKLVLQSPSFSMGSQRTHVLRIHDYAMTSQELEERFPT